MKRLKRALSVTKSAPRIEESISEVDEYLRETHLLGDNPPATVEENGCTADFSSAYRNNNKKDGNLTVSHSQSVVSNDSGHGSGNEQEASTTATMYSPVKHRNPPSSRKAWEMRMKRMSLPANFDNMLDSSNLSPPKPGSMTPSRRDRRISLSEAGYGKISSYTKLDKLGEGTYATVFKGKSKLTDTIVALKEIRLEHEEGAPCTAIREVSLLKDLKHINIVTLHDIIHTAKSLTLVFEYLEKDLKSYMDDSGGIISLGNVKIFLFQLLRGLDYCHKRKVLHRDLKPQNLLINEKGELKLADFGLARAKSVPTKTYSNEVVTLWYRPPDVLLGSTDYNYSIDMWGVGCIFFEMVSGRPMFPGSTPENELTLIFKMLGTPNERTWPGIERNADFVNSNYPMYRPEKLHNHVPRIELDGLDLLQKFIKYVPTQRISASMAMSNSYFSTLGPGVFRLKDSETIFTATDLQLTKDPGYRGARGSSHGGTRRRLSVLF